MVLPVRQQYNTCLLITLPPTWYVGTPPTVLRVRTKNYFPLLVEYFVVALTTDIFTVGLYKWHQPRTLMSARTVGLGFIENIEDEEVGGG